MKSLVLASTSPRRKELLALLQVPFEVVDPKFHEWIHAEVPPEAQAWTFALGKAQSCAQPYDDGLVLGSDTLIAVGELILGKAADRAQADAMLRRLRGRDHRIYTAVALYDPARKLQDVAVETVQVWMKPFSDADLNAYLESGEWEGKAGAYSIQGRGGDFIERIEGDYTAAVGLPLRLTASLLKKHGLSVPVDVEHLYRTKPYPNWSAFHV
ncbi:MAG: septum formation protein Maf [Nitrospirae bacterium RIFCSPLOWO2_02_FULL_62_14]|nr:MAG: septum formation protein Maf [Nitrospirae bacterium RIFCSPLOWO2_02_FULL_62_14]OGW67033.1 MAG: septum formation protein Maf [Nitrospirae bacterium RIFCSPLOWO2_01_FULL_62_17]